MGMSTFVIYICGLFVLTSHVTCEVTCTSGQFYDRPTSTCRTCSVCQEVTRIVCHDDKDSVCGQFKDVFGRMFYSRIQETESTKGKTLGARGESRDVEISQEDRWHHVTFALTCILCTLSSILVVLMVVACTVYRKSRKGTNLYTIPAYQCESTRFTIPKYPDIGFTENVSLVTKVKQEDV